MSADQQDQKKKTLSLSNKTLQIKRTAVEGGQIRQSFSHGRTKTVALEVKKKRIADLKGGNQHEGANAIAASLGLTQPEWEARVRALEARADEERRQKEVTEAAQEKELNRPSLDKEALEPREPEQDHQVTSLPRQQQRHTQEDVRMPSHESVAVSPSVPEDNTFKIIKTLQRPTKPAIAATVEESSKTPKPGVRRYDEKEEGEARAKPKHVREDIKKAPVAQKRGDISKVQYSRLAFTADEGDDGVDNFGRARFRKPLRKKSPKPIEEKKKVIRDVIIPEVITVQELSNRMAVRAAEVVKALMQMGVMATVTQSIDADTAELVVLEFGHTAKKVAMTDVEIGLEDTDDAVLMPRAPVVTVMGHVDHGKTSLLDAIRQADVVAQEAGGITQHIGAYQVTLPAGQKVTFIDTPGHAAFTEMRSRGANVTDIVILVVAADDGIMEQTVEAINHAKAAQVPIIVAINKIDKPAADPLRVRNELLQHELVLEELGGDVMSIEVSAKQKLNLDKLLEAVLLQAEVLDLKAPVNCRATGVVVEAKVERGRGSIATVLIQKGTLAVGDVFVAGAEYGRIRALVDDHGHSLKQAYPSMAVEVLGFTGAPSPGDTLTVVENETRAREVAEFRSHQQKELKVALSHKTSVESLFAQSKEGAKKELAVVIKSDVQGSIEAIHGSFAKLSTEEVGVKVLHTGVGGINESDVALAKASNALIVGFNVRANPQARDIAGRDGIEIRYYSIIYDIIDDVRALLSGMLSPILHENFLGYAEIRNVFNITKVGKVAGCMVTQGSVKRGAKVRLLRDNVVIHEGALKTLKRFKDEVKEAREGFECGMAFENYHDIRVGDVIECFEIEQKAREL